MTDTDNQMAAAGVPENGNTGSEYRAENASPAAHSTPTDSGERTGTVAGPGPPPTHAGEVLSDEEQDHVTEAMLRSICEGFAALRSRLRDAEEHSDNLEFLLKQRREQTRKLEANLHTLQTAIDSDLINWAYDIVRWMTEMPDNLCHHLGLEPLSPQEKQELTTHIQNTKTALEPLFSPPPHSGHSG